MSMKTYSGIVKLVCLLVLAPLVIWKLGIGNTCNLYKEKQKAEALSQKAPEPIKDSGQALFSVASAPLLSNGNLLQLFTDSLAANRVKVVSYTPEMIDSEGNYQLYCGKLLLAGGYIDLVKVISILESATLPLKIVSASFEHDDKKRDASPDVSLHLLIEQIEHD